MTTPLSDERIVEIRAREQAATPGPWAARHRACDRTPDDDDDGFLGLEVDGPPEASARGQFARGADAIFIAHARTDVPDLLAEVERLRAENADQRLEIAGWKMTVDMGRYVTASWRQESEQNEAEVDRLRARNAELEDVDNRVQAMADRMAEQAADNLLRAREAERRVARLKGVLREVEWGADTYVYDDDGGRTIPTCPRCFSERNDGHSPDCALDAALRDGE